MGRVAEDGGERFDVSESHDLADASVVAQPERRNDGGDDGKQGRGIDFAGRDTLVVMDLMGFVAQAFEDVLQVVGNEIHTHEE